MAAVTAASSALASGSGSWSSATSNNESSNNECNDSDTVHLIVLVHGWKGDSKEMNYMKGSLLRQAEQHPSSGRFLVYASTVNQGQTSDGIAAGGSRLATEVTDIIQSHRAHGKQVTLSFVGNSLGGLYSRYALSEIDSSIAEPMVFCTTATPHLGVSQHTYVPLPRWGEWVVAHSMWPTGRDLFQYTPVMQEMAFEPRFKTPLQRFRRRIAYANAHATDFQVPTCTAAFLSPESPHPHVTVEDDFFALTVETPHTTEFVDDDTMAHSLDAMGWTKVFCDNRANIKGPALPLPFSSHVDIPIKSTWSTKELIPIVTSVGSHWKFPLGHQVLVANSKSPGYERLSAGGQPIVDRMAASLIRDIVSFAPDVRQEQESGSESEYLA
jgi:hypothetical protein